MTSLGRMTNADAMPSAAAARKNHKKINSQVDEFLKRGGSIVEVSAGEANPPNARAVLSAAICPKRDTL